MENTPKFCYNCGVPLSPGARFCASCGQPVAGLGVVMPAASPAASTPAKRRASPWLTLVLGLLLGAIIAGGAVYLLARPVQSGISSDWVDMWKVTCAYDYQSQTQCFTQSVDGKYRPNPNTKPNERDFYFDVHKVDAKRLITEVGEQGMPQPAQIELALSDDNSQIFITISAGGSPQNQKQTYILTRRAP
jgi:hypothetical protein